MLNRLLLPGFLASMIILIVYLPDAYSKKDSISKQDLVCLECHEEIKSLKRGTKHAFLPCSRCHSKFEEHLSNWERSPETHLEASLCGQCHPSQYETFIQVNIKSKAKVEKSTTTSRSPTFEKLLSPHSFIKEHNEPRSHGFMLVDHLLVDRAYGGRFQLKTWKEISKVGNVWDLVRDTGREFPQTAKAGNTVCLTCKSTDAILRWPYMGEPHPSADLKRGGNAGAIYMARRYLKNPMSCTHCHDPHGAKPRVVKDALIQAVIDRKEGTYPYDQEKSKKTQMEKIEFFRNGKPFRAIGILNKPDSILLCAQCHVEYNCNPGFDPKTGAPIGMEDQRTNYFPWVNVFDIQKKYERIGFKDFKHQVTGAPITKLQHPEVETYWGSLHEGKGVECKDCHMPKVKDKKGKLFTFHGQRSSRYMLKDTCVRCHSSWSLEEAEYQVDAIQNYIRGKMRKAEFWLGKLIETYLRAKDLGVKDEILREVWPLHDKAHIHWEWWTAENSDGFHNPKLARESLSESISATQEAIKFLEKAIEEKKK
ncbi:MAG: ammonia-forming cytochrome c nitrite reductase subunit c552 [Thermodesulfobacteriota bacterium]